MNTEFKRSIFKFSFSPWIFAACLTVFLVSACASPEEKISDYINSGMKLLAAGEIDKAKIEFKNALQIKKNNNDALYGLALAFEKEADWQKVYNLCLQITEQDPKYFNAYLKLGQLYLASGELDNAIDTVKILQKLQTNNADVFALKASILLKLGDTNGALADAKHALEIDSKNGQAIVVMASERTAVKDYEAALTHLNQGISNNPDNVTLYMIKIVTLESAGRIEEAEHVYLTLIKRFPNEKAYRQQLAIFYVKNQQGDKGERLLQAIVDQDPKSVQAKIDLIQLIRATRGDAAAADTLARFIKADPRNYDMRFAQIVFLEKIGRGEQAYTLAQQLSGEDADPDQVNKAKLFQASYLLQSGKRDAAKTLIDSILKEDKRNDTALQMKASMELDERHYESAIALLRTILREAPNSSSALMMLGKAHDLSGSRDLAEKHYLMAVEFAGNNGKNYVIPYVEFLTKYAEYDRAEKLLQELIDIQQADNTVLTMLAKLKLQKGDWLGAQDIANRIKAQTGDNQLANSILGNVFKGQKNYSESIDAFKRSYESNPQNSNAMLALIRTYVEADKTKEAIQFLDNLVKTNANAVNAQILLAKVHVKNNSKALAIQIYQSLVKSHPPMVEPHQQLSELLRDSGRDQEAIAVASNGLKAIPNNPNLQFVLASIYEKLNNYDEAIKMYEAINSRFPNEEVIVNNLVSLITDHKTDPQSLKRAYDLVQAISKSDSPFIKDTVGWAAYKIGRYGEAAEMLKQSIAKMPKYALFQYHYGMANVQLKNKVEAKNAFEKALKYKQLGDGLPENEIRQLLTTL